MRLVLACAALMLTSCAHFERNTSQMTADQILQRSTHVCIGVIEKHEVPNRFLFSVSGKDSDGWRVTRRRVRVEMVLRGIETRPVIDVYEVFPDGGVSGDWNLTNDNRRYLFPVRLEDGRYHLARDFWRSIYPVHSGRHNKLPLDDSRPLWERFALLQWWVQPDRSPAFGRRTSHIDPGRRLGRWRTTKILRGLSRHPDADVRLAACHDLQRMDMSQDECWDPLPSKTRQTLSNFADFIPSQESWAQNRHFETLALQYWEWAGDDIDELRLFTTINNPLLRRKFCALFLQRFPEDTDNGCSPDSRPPATIVTADGDIPLPGAWPKL